MKIKLLIFLFSFFIGISTVPETCEGVWIQYEDHRVCEKICGSPM